MNHWVYWFSRFVTTIYNIVYVHSLHYDDIALLCARGKAKQGKCKWSILPLQSAVPPFRHKFTQLVVTTRLVRLCLLTLRLMKFVFGHLPAHTVGCGSSPIVNIYSNLVIFITNHPVFPSVPALLLRGFETLKVYDWWRWFVLEIVVVCMLHLIK